MGKREELITKLEVKLAEKQQVAKRFQQSPSDYASPDPDPGKQRMFEMNIRAMEKLDNGIYDLIELIKLLPEEDSPPAKQKREQLAATIEREAERLHELNRQRNDAQQDMTRRILDNRISELAGFLDAHKKLLSTL